LIGTLVLGAGAICDWTRPPREQISVAVYDKVVVGGYRQFLQPVTHRFIRCRFQPTCSQYSEEAMRAHGFPKGLWLTTSRLFRCMPWVATGTRDPVPP
jgi:putative membrane protein insertion efficiency factor